MSVCWMVWSCSRTAVQDWHANRAWNPLERSALVFPQQPCQQVRFAVAKPQHFGLPRDPNVGYF